MFNWTHSISIEVCPHQALLPGSLTFCDLKKDGKGRTTGNQVLLVYYSSEKWDGCAIVNEIHSSKRQRYLKPQEYERNLLFCFHVYNRLMWGRKPGPWTFSGQRPGKPGSNGSEAAGRGMRTASQAVGPFDKGQAAIWDHPGFRSAFRSTIWA